MTSKVGREIQQVKVLPAQSLASGAVASLAWCIGYGIQGTFQNVDSPNPHQKLRPSQSALAKALLVGFSLAVARVDSGRCARPWHDFLSQRGRGEKTPKHLVRCARGRGTSAAKKQTFAAKASFSGGASTHWRRLLAHMLERSRFSPLAHGPPRTASHFLETGSVDVHALSQFWCGSADVLSNLAEFPV